METQNDYHIALLDGDLLIIAPSLLAPYIAADASLHRQDTGTSPVSTIAHRMLSRETELLHLLPLWSE